ncbi:MAG: carboxypeptidase-like regulatory domain-containing protein, partial [Candidatus Bathyarchaeota archaeon]|nr:carboxypeptidase-like regulatory domain-containing protein [Candidatus Bathyarchaeota archaeon]
IPLKNVEVKVYEWSSGVAEPVRSETTDDLGSAVFQNLTFGRYKVWVYNEDHTIILNKTVVDLTEDQLFFVVHCKIFNVDLSVIVKDYFGQPISNALVEVKRENGSILSPKTVSKGTYSFYNLTGGDCQISVSVMGTVSETRTLYLDEAKVVVFKLEKFAVVSGFLLEVTQLIAYVSLGIVITVFALALIYRRLRLRKRPEEEKEKSL